MFLAHSAFGAGSAEEANSIDGFSEPFDQVELGLEPGLVAFLVEHNLLKEQPRTDVTFGAGFLRRLCIFV